MKTSQQKLQQSSGKASDTTNCNASLHTPLQSYTNDVTCRYASDVTERNTGITRRYKDVMRNATLCVIQLVTRVKLLPKHLINLSIKNTLRGGYGYEVQQC